MKKVSKGLVLISIFCFYYQNFGFAAEFSADLIQKDQGETVKYKVYLKGDKVRKEVSDGGKVIIIRPDKGISGVVWTIVLTDKMYMELPISMADKDIAELESKSGEKVEKKYLGQENINGYLCDKYEIIFKERPLGKITQWFSKKLNVSLKMESDILYQEYNNIEEQKLSDSLFEIPPEYTKILEGQECCP